ncbi:MAG TPA: hypothetical protein VFZ78_06015 [Flavisolibacter sp.]
MSFLLIDLSLIEISVLLVGAFILALAIYFFIDSRRSLQQTLRDNKLVIPAKKEKAKAVRETPLPQPVPELAERRLQPVAETPRADLSHDLKATIMQQQRILDGLLKQVEEAENDGKDQLRAENEELLDDIRRLEELIDKKNGEINGLKQQAALAQKLTTRVEEIYHEFEQLQQKMVILEKQASRANNLAIELEDTRQAYEQVHKELTRKQERLDESFEENQRLQLVLNAVEDKLAEANVQRQQLQKKVQFLQDLNTDMQTMSDTNQKLKTELRRIGELESMLNMIAEERDYLLKRQADK